MRLVLPLALVVSLAIAGCASSPRNSEPASSSKPAAAAPAQRIATPVALPKGAAKKVVLSMTGPKTVVESKDWAEFQREWRETFAEHAKEAGIAFAFVDAGNRPAPEDGTLLNVEVADYRIVGIGARIFFGVMTGNAYIDAKVRYADLRDGKPLGEQQFNTSSSAWGGIFAKVTPQQVDAIATDIFQDLKAAR